MRHPKPPLAFILALGLVAACSRHDDAKVTGDLRNAGHDVDRAAGAVAHDARKAAAEAKAAAHDLAADSRRAAHDAARPTSRDTAG
jgi:hypothetical protein